MSDYKMKVFRDLLEWISNCNRSQGRESSGIQADVDLLSTGVLDSLDFTKLLVYIEDKYNVIVDLIDTDPYELSTVEGLVNYITNVQVDPYA